MKRYSNKVAAAFTRDVKRSKTSEATGNVSRIAQARSPASTSRPSGAARASCRHRRSGGDGVGLEVTPRSRPRSRATPTGARSASPSTAPATTRTRRSPTARPSPRAPPATSTATASSRASNAAGRSTTAGSSRRRSSSPTGSGRAVGDLRAQPSGVRGRSRRHTSRNGSAPTASVATVPRGPVGAGVGRQPAAGERAARATSATFIGRSRCAAT